MSAKQKMCTVMDLPTSILASLFAPLMFAGLPNHFPLLTMSYLKIKSSHFFSAVMRCKCPSGAETDDPRVAVVFSIHVWNSGNWLSIHLLLLYQF